MSGYLVRRFIQMAIVVLVATMAIYALLNLAPGGPLSGLNTTADRRARYSEADKARLEAYLGLDKPLVLRYLVWLLGDDWLGADYMYLGLRPPENMRFYSKPGIAYSRAGYPIWVEGVQTGTATDMGEDGNPEEVYVIEASKIWIRPDGDPAEGLWRAQIISSREGGVLKVDVTANPMDAVIYTTQETQWEVAIASEHPEGAWVNVSWLFGPYGLLGRYAHFHGVSHGVLRMDFGTSWSVARGQPISMLIESRLGNTILLMSISTLLSLIIAIPAGVYSAVKQYSKMDYAITTLAFFGSAMPVFWFGLMVILIFTIKFQEWGLPYMPASGIVSARAAPTGSLLDVLNSQPGDFLDRFLHLFMPCMVLSLLYIAGWSRFMRGAMLEVLRLDYVRTARAKGLSERVVIVKHAMRNALIPLVTIVVFTIPGLFGGAIITETIFSWPGMGRLYFSALGADDWPLVMVLLFIQAVLTVIATLTGDILYTVVDPRVRYD